MASPPPEILDLATDIARYFQSEIQSAWSQGRRLVVTHHHAQAVAQLMVLRQILGEPKE